MDQTQLRALTLRQTDIDGALRRFYGDEQLYITCLIQFLSDPTMDELNRTVARHDWDEAFTAAHALKGLAGNMGFVPLLHATAQLVVLIRGGRLREIDDSMFQVNSSYRDIIDAIKMNFPVPDDTEKENNHEDGKERS